MRAGRSALVNSSAGVECPPREVVRSEEARADVPRTVVERQQHGHDEEARPVLGQRDERALERRDVVGVVGIGWEQGWKGGVEWGGVKWYGVQGCGVGWSEM